MKTFFKELINAGGEIYEVGGVIRDKFLGKETKDSDYLVRKLPIAEISKILKKHGKVTFAGKSFGVIKFIDNDEHIPIDIALPRIEKSTGTGHKDFEIDFDPNIKIEDDLGRRDFTINAMAKNIATGKIIDPFNGQKDIKNKIIKQVFENSFIEDPLRMLRAIQFAARFDMKIEEKTWQSLKQNAKLIKTVSEERVSEELQKLFLAKSPSIGFDYMLSSGILEIILPEISILTGIEQDKQPGDDVYRHTMKALDATASDEMIDNKQCFDLMWAALFHDTGKARTARVHPKEKRIVFFGHQIVSARIAQKSLKRLKASAVGVNIEEVVKLINNHMFETKAFFSEKAIRRFIKKIGPELIFKQIDLRLADNRAGKHPKNTKGVERMRKRIIAELEKKPPFGAKDLKINGHDLMKIGLNPGPAMGYVLNKLVEEVLDKPEFNEKDVLIKISKRLIKELPREVKKKEK